MNDFYSSPSDQSDFTRARAAHLNNVDAAVDAAFDKLPSLATVKEVVQSAVVAGGTANALTLTLDKTISAYAMGQRIAFKATANNTGAATINVDSVGVVSLLRPSGAAMEAGDLSTGRIYEAIYDGSAFQIVGALINAGDGDLAAAIAAAVPAEVATALTNAQFTGAPISDVYAITDGASVDIDPENGGIQTWTLGANRTPTATNFQNGNTIVLKVDDGAAYSITWSSIAPIWKTDGGAAPTLNTSGYTTIALWKVAGVVYGARVGDA